MSQLILGLDIGITSVGYGVIDLENNQIVDYGIRLFEEGTAENNVARRTHRSSRRLKRRKHLRIEDMKRLLEREGIYEGNISTSKNPYEIRVKGLKEKLSNDELSIALLHITKHRGSNFDTVDEDDPKEESKEVVNNSVFASKDQFVCEIQLQRLKERGKVRGIDNNPKTADYLREVKEILKHQDLDEHLQNEILHIIQRKRAYCDGPGSEKSPTPYGRWIDFGVEPIDLIDKMRGKCSVFPDELRAPKRSYTAELFNLLNDLNNLTISGDKITNSQKMEVIQYVDKHGGITPKQFSKLLGVDLDKIDGFRIDKNNKPLLTEFTGYRAFKKIFDQHHISIDEDKRIIDNLAEILTKKKGISERKEAIEECYPDLPEAMISDLIQMKGMTQYHALSFKAMREISTEMLKSSDNQMQVLHKLNLFNQNRPSMKGKKNIQIDDEAILSPVVKRSFRETIKVVNALRKRYGEFDTIVIEMTRDKNSKEKRKRIQDSQKYFENEKKNVDNLLKDMGYDPDKIISQVKLKIRLYLQQDGKSAYTQKTMDIREIIMDPNAYEIDHILPISVSLDDSIHNKVLVTHAENQVKGNMTPIAAYLSGKFRDIGGNYDLFKSYVTNSQLSSAKKKNLLYEKDITKFENMQEFIARNLIDTSYACRTALNTLQNYFKDNDIDTKVHTVRGKLTDLFRKRINLSKDREENYLHHAIDALIVASIKKLNILNTYLAKYNIDALYDENTGEVLKVEDEKALLNEQHLYFIHQLRTIYDESSQYYHGLINKEDMHYSPIKISHKVDTKPNRQIADETIYSTRMVGTEEKVVKKYSNIYDPKFDKLTNDIISIQSEAKEKYLMYHHDPQTFKLIEDIILDHFNTYKEDETVYKKDTKNGYVLKGSNNPLALYEQEHGKVRKFSHKGNGPEITMMKYYDSHLGNHLDVTPENAEHKKVVLLQLSPYRTDFYISPTGKYNFVTIRYCHVYYKKSMKKYTINPAWYESEKQKKKIDDSWKFVCSLHHHELIGLKKKDGKDYIFDLSKLSQGEKQYYHGNIEILKFTATNNDKKGAFEVKPRYVYCQKQLMPSIGAFTLVEKYATDVLGNLYKVTDNVLKLEFD